MPQQLSTWLLKWWRWWPGMCTSLVGPFLFGEVFWGRVWEREEILSVDSRALNENTKIWRKVLEKIIHTTNYKWVDKWKQSQIISTLRENPEREKRREREFTIMLDDCKEFCSVMLWLQSLRSDGNQKLIPFLLEMEMNLYPPELFWVQIFWIYIIEWFACYDLLITTQIMLLDY